MAQWNPFQEMEALRKEMDRLFGTIGSQTLPFARASFLPGRAARRYPLVNISEDKDTYYVEALAPGVDPNNLNLSVIRNTLTISGEKLRVGAEVKPDAYHRNERAAGRFVRTVELPAEVDEAKVKADYKNGLLLVTLPKHEKAKPKQVAINAG